MKLAKAGAKLSRVDSRLTMIGTDQLASKMQRPINAVIGRITLLLDPQFKWIHKSVSEPLGLYNLPFESISHTTPRSIQSSWLKTQETLVTPLATPPAKASRGEYLHLKLLLLRKSGKPDTIGSPPS